MRDRASEISGAGGSVVLVGTGTPQFAAAFAESWAAGLPVYSDTERGAFRAAGMRRGWTATLNWRLIRNLLRALRAGFRQQKVQGDPWQQGGVVVVTRGADPKSVRLLHAELDRAAGDPIDVDAVVASLRAP